MGPPSVAAVAFQFQPNSFPSVITEPRGTTFLDAVSFASLGITSPLVKAEMSPSPRVDGPAAKAVARQQPTHVHQDGDATPENPAALATSTANNTPGAPQPSNTCSPQATGSHFTPAKKCKTVRFSAAKEIFDGHCVTPPPSEDLDAADEDSVSPPAQISNSTEARVELQSALLERLSIADGPLPDAIHRHRVPTFAAKIEVPGTSDGPTYQRRASASFGSFAPAVLPDCAEHSQISAFFTHGDEKEQSAVATEADRFLPSAHANVLFTHVLQGDGFPMLLSSVTPSPTIQIPSSTFSQQYRPSITPESLGVYRASTGGAQYGNADCNNVDAENFVLNRTRVPILPPQSAQQAGHGFYGSHSLPTSPNAIGDAGYFQMRRPQHPLLSPVDSYHAAVDVAVHDQVQSAAAYAAMYSYHQHQSAAGSMAAGHAATPLRGHLAPIHPMPSAVSAITPTGPYGAAVPPRANFLLAYHNLQQPPPPAMPNSLRLADRLSCNHKGYQKRFAAEEKANRYAGVVLEDVVGEIYSLCKDQHGCRFLQKKVEERNEKYIEMIYKEVFGRFAELMTDPFGNYLCQKLLEHCSDRQRTAIVEFVASDLVHIAFNMHGTRAVQKMIEFASNQQQTLAIVTALGPHVVVLIKDLNGNHVIQKCLSKLRSEDNQFIYNSVCQSCVEVATHRHGCCVLQRCIDYASDMQKVQLVIEITYHALTLVQDPFGNYVVQYVLDLGDSRFSDAVTRKFVGNVCLLSVQKFSSNVMEKCIRVAETDTRRALISEMLNLDRLDKLLRDAYANYVVQTALDYADPDQKLHLVECMRPLLPAIRHTPYGKRILSKLQRDLIPPVIGQTGKNGMNGQAAHDGFLIHQHLGNGNGQLMPVTVDYKGCFLPYM